MREGQPKNAERKPPFFSIILKGKRRKQTAQVLIGQNAKLKERAIRLSEVKKKEGTNLLVVSSLFSKPLTKKFYRLGGDDKGRSGH